MREGEVFHGFVVGENSCLTQTAMKILMTILLLTLSFSLFAQHKLAGRYRDYFGSRIQLNGDNTFKYTWNFDMMGSWTKGTWTLAGDTVYLQMVPTYDTLIKTNSSGILSDTLILSTDEVSECFTQREFDAMLFSGGGQNRMDYPGKLVFKKGRLYKIQNGKLLRKKQKSWTSKKWHPWFFKSDE
jgi:hypothetical protein